MMIDESPTLATDIIIRLIKIYMTQSKNNINGLEEVEETLVKKKTRFLFWQVTSWEVVSRESIGNDVFIETDKPVRNIYLNRKLLQANSS